MQATNAQVCKVCRGSGNVIAKGDVCEVCNGDGIDSHDRPCYACGGYGNKRYKESCPECHPGGKN
ncbi:MAG: hypothetical protein IT292_00675 [Deltaproteobacteria bacterium]|nr:hypothetical protein [Deltaproteobacteria bacterium]